MRKSIALACLLSALVASPTLAQCPNSCGNRVLAPVQAHCQSFSQPTCRIAPTHVRAGRIQNRCVVAQRYPVVQGYPAVQSITNSSTRPWSVIAQSTVTQNAQHAAQNNCNCSGTAGKMPSSSLQSSPQTASVVQQERNPFSLAGHPQEVKPVEYCLQEFLLCCERGGKDCMINYYKCSEITGEQLRYNVCPAQAPKVED